MKKIIALAVAGVIAAPAMADLTIGASARYQIDNGTYTAATNPDALTAADAAAVNSLGEQTELGAVDTAAGASNSNTAVPTNRVLVSFSGSTTAESGVYVSAAATLQLAGAAASTDGDNALTIGNEAANVVLGFAEPAGAFNSGADQFQNSSLVGYEGSLRARESENVILNITAVENLTAQISTNVDTQDDVRLVLGYDFGGFAVTAASEQMDGADNGFSITGSTTISDVALAASFAESGSVTSTNVNVSYMGFGLAMQKDDMGAADEQEIYGSYAVANAAGVEGFTVTVGAGDSNADGVDTRYGVRLDYAF